MPEHRSTIANIAIAFLMTLVLAACLSADAAAQPTASPAREVSEALRAGDLVSARAALARWVEASPDDPRLHYNLACLDAQLGEPAAAVALLGEAFRLGFDDVRRAEADPDLALLREREDFRALLDATEAALTATAAEQRLRLGWGEPQRLELAGGRRSADVAVDESGLAVSITLPASEIVPGNEPWYAGGGVVLTVTAPHPDDSFDSRRAWRFGFGMRDGLATGAVLSHPGRLIDQVVLDLAPVMEWDTADGTRTVGITIPWSHLAPYAPPADTLFGLNVEIIGGGGVPIAALVPDPASGFPDPRRRRYRPLAVVLGPATPTALHGRVTDTIVGNRPLAIDLTAWFPDAGFSELFTEIQDNDGNSVVTSGETSGAVDIQPGRNDWRRWADLSRLPDGPYRLLATLALDDGTVLTWGTGLFRFGGGWMPRTRDRIKPLPEAEQPTMYWRLDLVADALVDRDPRQSPAPLITTVAETERLLTRFRDTGTILPSGGDLNAFVPAPDGPGHTALILTPAGWNLVDTSPVVLVDGPDGMVDALRTDGAFRDDPVIVRLPAALAGTPAVLEATVAWLRVLLPGLPVVLVSPDPSETAGADAAVAWRRGEPAVAAAVRAALGGE